MIGEVESENICDFTDWVGDRWYDFEEWTGRLDIKNYVTNVNAYHRKVIDKNNTTKESIERIFEDVAAVNDSYSSLFSRFKANLNAINNYLDTMNNTVSPIKENFNSEYITSKFDFVSSEINAVSAQRFRDELVQDIDGVSCYNVM